MHAYRILLHSETDDSRFNSREKHMLTNSVQPYIENNWKISGTYALQRKLKHQTLSKRLVRLQKRMSDLFWLPCALPCGQGTCRRLDLTSIGQHIPFLGLGRTKQP